MLYLISIYIYDIAIIWASRVIKIKVISWFNAKAPMPLQGKHLCQRLPRRVQPVWPVGRSSGISCDHVLSSPQSDLLTAFCWKKPWPLELSLQFSRFTLMHSIVSCHAVSCRVVPSWPSDPGQKALAAPPIEAPRWLALDVRRSSLRLPRSSWSSGSSRSSWSCWSCIDTEICWSYKVTSVIFSRIQDGPFAEPTSD